MRQNPHVRICGGPGSATTLVYPTAHCRHCRGHHCRDAGPSYSRTVSVTSTLMLSPVTRSAAAVYWLDCPSRSSSVLLD